MLALLSFCLSAGLTALARRIAPKLGFVDRPDDGHKGHAKPTPLLGGVAMYLSLATVVTFAWLSGTSPISSQPDGISSLVLLLCTAGAICGLGLYDDRRGLRARHKFLWQIVIISPYAVLATSIESIGLLGLHLHLGWAGLGFVVFWLVACTNVINLADGMDGLAGSISLVALATIGILSGWSAGEAVALFSYTVCGAIAGFLLHNWPPSKIFMGDAGSLTLGFLVGGLSCEAAVKQATTFTLAVPLVLISIPIFDTTVAIVRRKLMGRGIGTGDRHHFHHRLLHRGLRPRQALFALVTLCLIMALAVLASVRFDADWIAVGVCAATLGLLVAAKIFGHRELALFWQHIVAAGVLILDTSHVYRSRIAVVRQDDEEDGKQADACERRWEIVCNRLRSMGGRHAEFSCSSPDGEPRNLPERRFEFADSSPGSVRWEFRYSTFRDDQRRASVRVVGEGASNLNRQRFDDLFRLLAAFCQIDSIDSESVSLIADLRTSQEIAGANDAAEKTILSMKQQPAPTANQEFAGRRAA